MKPNSIWIGLIVCLLFTMFLSPIKAVAQANLPMQTIINTLEKEESEGPYRYRLFETTNMWTFLLLDTTTGRAWQIQYSMDENPGMKMIINEKSLLPKGAALKSGRFTLNKTQNMYTFLLLDRNDSRIWQIQWSQDTELRGIVGTIH